MSSIARIVILFSIIGCVHSMTVTVLQKFVTVTRGETTYLQCTFSTSEPTTNLIVQWSFISKSSMDSEQMYYYQAGDNPVIGKRFVGRLKMLSSPNITNNASIAISNMEPQDAGTYTCDIHNFPDVTGKTEGIVMVTVLEKPSVPFCAVHGDVETGHLVTLTCHTELGSPTPTYTWTKLDQGRTKSRKALGITNVKTGILSIRNISQFEFGEYQCNASNIAGFSTCIIDLTEEISDGAIAGAVIGALLAACFIFLLAWFITHTLKKQKYKAAMANSKRQSQPQSESAVKYEGVPSGESAHQAQLQSPEKEEAEA